MSIVTSSHYNTVGVVEDKAVYPQKTPYHPHIAYPEYPFTGEISQEENVVYDSVRKLFLQMEYDIRNQNTPLWNPLGFMISPGMRVVIKPNFVLSFHRRGKNLYSIITHPSVLRVVADYCWIALQGSGHIIIADAPQYNCNFDALVKTTGLDAIASFYNKFSGPKFSFVDLRHYWSAGKHFPSLCQPLPGDTAGTTRVDLGKDSALYGRNSSRYYGAVYHRQETIAHHSNERHEYEISNTVLQADVVISVPKMKVHKKVGVTLNAKGCVGIATSKNLLVHYTLGTPKEGGDQFPDDFLKPHEKFLIKLERFFYDLFLAKRSVPLEYIHRSLYAIHGVFTRKLGLTVGKHKGYPKRIFDAGNWYGNDTAWRMSADLMKILYFADRDGRMQTTRQRCLFSVVDGVIGGQGEGPLEPDPKASGVLLCGENFAAVDIVAARLMGIAPFALKLYKNLLSDKKYSFGIDTTGDIAVRSANESFVKCLDDTTARFFNYQMHPGWKGYIEVNPQKSERII